MREEADDIRKKTVVYEMPGMDAVRILRDVEYSKSDTGAEMMDIYYPADVESEARVPAVIIVAGYPDPGFEAKVGCKFKEMGSSVSWGRLIAASGLTAITYANREPISSAAALLQHLRQNSASLGIDENRIGLWASSGNVPLALGLLMEGEYLKCAALCYGYLLDLDGARGVSKMSAMFGFANPCAGKSVDDLPKNVPLLIVRAGRDQMPHLNETIDRFLPRALACNLPFRLVNHSAAPHAFDLSDDSETSREIIRQVLSFMRFHLSA
jgi:hypothetical protein